MSEKYRSSVDWKIAMCAYQQFLHSTELYFESLHRGDMKNSAKHFQSRNFAIQELSKTNPEILASIYSSKHS
jgi:hypothetical protein